MDTSACLCKYAGPLASGLAFPKHSLTTILPLYMYVEWKREGTYELLENLFNPT